MTTPEERREAAEELRKLAESKFAKHLGGSHSATDCDLWCLDETKAAVGLSRICSPSDLMLALADLIDPTCKVEGTIRRDWESGYGGTEYEHSLSCGHVATMLDDFPPDYCPRCGSRVVDE